MLSIKKLLLCSISILVSAPLLAQATNLTTHNNTNEDSAVKVLKTGICSSKVPIFGTYTKAHSTSTVSPLGVRAICGGVLGKGTCAADIYMTQDCSGTNVATATLDLASMTVKQIESKNKKYRITFTGSTVYIDYA